MTLVSDLVVLLVADLADLLQNKVTAALFGDGSLECPGHYIRGRGLIEA